MWSIDFAPNGRLLASCSGDKTLRIWSIPQEQTLKSLNSSQTSPSKTAFPLCCTIDDAHRRTVRSVRFNPDGKLVASAGFDAVTGIWERQDSDETDSDIRSLGKCPV